MIGLVVCTYDRPEYLKMCLDSLIEADLSKCMVIVIDDASDNQETIRLINEFNPNTLVHKHFSKTNGSIKQSLLMGWDMCERYNCEIFVNLDGDAIVKPHFIDTLEKLVQDHPEHIATGFNSRNTKLDGSPRHPIKKEHRTYIEKTSVGGINMAFKPEVYQAYVRPVLEKSLQSRLNWDDHTCRALVAANKHIVVSKPSVVQHIGFDSSMGHREEPDVAYDFEDKIKLDTVTLTGADCVDPNRLKIAADKSQGQIDFAAVKLFTDRRLEGFCKIPPITTKEQYSRFILSELYKHIDTTHALVIQYDGYVLNPSAWDDDWLQYDYIGAPWDWYKEYCNGNGGFSLRSKKLMEAAAKMNPSKVHPEDDVICRTLRPKLEEMGFKFAPIDVCKLFSIEGFGLKPKFNYYDGQFGFHGKFVSMTKIKETTTRKPIPKKITKESQITSRAEQRRRRKRR